MSVLWIRVVCLTECESLSLILMGPTTISTVLIRFIFSVFCVFHFYFGSVRKALLFGTT